MERVILHSDMHNFYASVECMLNPELKAYPIAVCGDVEERHGIVLAKNYKAKAKGVSTGEAIWQAKQKCPGLLIVSPHYDEYMKYSKKARAIYGRYTDEIEPFGMDECWLDVSGSTRAFGSGEKIANEIKEAIKFELGLTVSVGVSYNKIFAKLGSDMKKPDAVTVITQDSYKEQIWGLPASDLLGIGRATTKKLASYGTIVCSQCGKKLYRHATWSKREKWFCTNGCKNDIYIGDQEIFDAITDAFVKAKSNPKSVENEGKVDTYNPSLAIVRQNNEINRLMDQSKVQFQAVKKLILQAFSIY